MSVQIDPDLLMNLKKFGVADAATCFNCGNCTAVCSLSSETNPFPRKTIRYLQLGLKDKLMTNPEPWLCYYCGDCSDTCPRQANPGEVMMGLRRYLISTYEPTGLARLFYRNNLFASLLTTAIAFILGILLVLTGPVYTGNISPVSRWLFDLVDYHVVEYLGIAVFLVVAVSMLGGLKNIITVLARNASGTANPDGMKNSGPFKFAYFFNSAWKAVKEVFSLKRYQSCNEGIDSRWYLKPWFIHGSIMWGFFGLALATVLDIPLLGFKAADAAAWLPSRILGIGAGLFLVYGTTIALFRRIRKADKMVEHSRFSDWLFLLILWALGITGFWLTLSVYFFQADRLHQLVLLIHTVMAMELLLLFAFSKFAHAVYRPIALFFYYLYEGK